MGISQQVGASSLNKPGVCTSTTRPATPYEGQMIYETNTDRVLVWNNSAWVVPNAPAQNPAGLELISSTTLAGSDITVPSCFSNTYDNYRIIVSNGATSNTGVYFYIQWTIAGTASATNYSWTYTGLREDNVGSPYFETSTTASLFTRGKLGMNPGFAGSVNNSSIDVYMPFLTARTFALFQSVSYPSPFAFVSGGISQDQSTSKDGFKLGVSAGTLTAGTVTVYGYRK